MIFLKYMQITHFLLLHVLTDAFLQQFIDPQFSHEFVSGDSPLHYPTSSPALSAHISSATFTILAWVKFHTSAAPVCFFALRTAGIDSVSIQRQADHSIAATVATQAGDVTVALSGCGTMCWVHAAVAVDTARVTLVITPWKAAATQNSAAIGSNAVGYQADASELLLGGTSPASLMIVTCTQGQLLDLQIDFANCFSTTEIAAIVSGAGCHSHCVNGCLGPGDKSCSDFIQLTEVRLARTVGASTVITWQKNDPHLQGFTFGAADYAFMGWYFDTENVRGWRNLFRSQTVLGDMGVSGQRVMTIFRNNGPRLHFTSDTTTATNYVFPEKTVRLNEWLFVATSDCHGVMTYCYAMATDPAPSCFPYTLPGSNVVWGTTANSALFLGDSYFGSIVGRLADHRYYFNTCLDSTTIAQIYQERKTFCIEGCTACSTPFECSTCSPGYFLQGTTCVRCHSCCLSCTGPSSADCQCCSPECQFDSSSHCLSTPYAGIQPNCGGKRGLRLWDCLDCAPGYFLQPDNFCLKVCPSGFVPIGAVCAPDSRIAFDFTFDKIAPTLVSAEGDIVAVNGNSMGYIEATDPLPSKHRGYFFTGSQYLKLPPGIDTSGSPAVISTSFTFLAWIRPQSGGVRTIYAKEQNCEEVLSVFIDGDGKVKLSGGTPQTVIADISAIPLDSWLYLVIVCEFDRGSGDTTVTFYRDNVQTGAFTVGFYFRDENLSANQAIGASAALTDMYAGFLWRVSLKNYVWREFSSGLQASACPAGLEFCLSPCPFLQTPDCQNCQSQCLYGCVRVSDCSLCADELCDSCSDFISFSCRLCISFADLTGQCACEGGRYYRHITRTCEFCPPVCQQCDAFDHCTQCFAPAELKAGECRCGQSFYPDIDARNCKQCREDCRTCANSESCLTCWENAHLTPSSSCECVEGFTGSPSRCISCGPGCAQCTSLCIQCFTGYFPFSGFCLSHCPEGYIEDKDLWKCTAVVKTDPLFASLQESGSELILSFSNSLSKELEDSDFLTSWLEGNTDTKIPHFLSPSIPLLTYNLTFSLPSDSPSDLLILLTFTANITDISESPLESQNLTGFLHLAESSSSGITVPLLSPTVAAAAQGSMISSGISGIMAGNPSSFFTLFSNAQLLSYIPLSGINLPKSVRSLLMALNMQSMLPNPFLYWVRNIDSKPPEFAQLYGFESCLFLANIGTVISIGIVFLAYFAVFSSIKHLCTGRFSSVIAVLEDKFRMNSLLRYWIQVYLDTAIAAMLQLWRVRYIQIELRSPTAVFNTVLSTAFLGGVVATPPIVLLVTLKNRDTILHMEPEQVKFWVPLFIEFTKESGIRGLLYYTVFTARRLLYASALLALADFPKLQSATFIATSLTVIPTKALLYLLYYRPFQSRVMQVDAILAEAGIAILSFLTAAYNYDLRSEASDIIAFACTLCVYASLASANVVSLYLTWQTVKKVARAYRAALKLAQLNNAPVVILRKQKNQGKIR